VITNRSTFEPACAVEVIMQAIVGYPAAFFIVLSFTGMARPDDRATIDAVWLEKAKTEGKAAYERYQTLASRVEERSEYRFEKAPGSTDATPFNAHTTQEWNVRLGDNMIRERVRIFDSELLC
jgi:hypothetical protein